MAHRKSLWTGLALEIFSIVFAVLLALGVNAWYQNLKEKQLVQSVLEDILVEVEHNTAELEIALQYHQTLADTLTHIFVSDAADVDSFDLRGVWRGAQVPAFQSAAYETAMITQALALMEFEISSRLALLYKQQQSLERLFERYLEAVLIAPEDPERTSHIVWMMAGDVVLGERALLELYRETNAYLVEKRVATDRRGL